MIDLSKINNLAITGANGFVGKSVVQQIASLPQERLPQNLTLITRSGLDFELPSAINSISISVNQDLIEKWAIPNQVTHLINLAADGSRDPYSVDSGKKFHQISRNLVDWIRGVDSKVKVFHASSGACFGYTPLIFGEHKSNSKEVFRQNRIEVESYLSNESKASGFELSIGRLFTFSGPNLLNKPQYALTNFIDSALKSRLISISGDPRTVRGYMDQTTMSEWILKSIQMEANHLDLQIGSSIPVTIGELADFIANQTSAELVNSKNPAPGDVYIADSAATQEKLGLGEGKFWKDSVIEMISKAREKNR